MRHQPGSTAILSTGAFVPEAVCTNQYLESIAGTNADWIQRTLGIRERRIAAKEEATSDLAVRAAKSAMAMGSLEPNDLDLIIVATATPDRPAPSTACIVQEKLGASRAAAFDLNAVCSGFMYALSVARQYVATGACQHVLVIGADTFSRLTDWSRRDCVFFGDGAGAVIVAPGKVDQGLLAIQLGADGRGRHAWTVPAGGSEQPACHRTVDEGRHYFQMNGRAVYDAATNIFPRAIHQVLDQARLSLSEIKFIIPHQPSVAILRETARRLGIGFKKVLVNLERYANTSAATVPILLDETNRKGWLDQGDLAVLAAVGSGWTWGAAVLRWANPSLASPGHGQRTEPFA